jgi:glucose/arabinose dehydrogenase
MTLARPASALPPDYEIERVKPSLGFPVAARFAPDGRCFYIERGTGQIRVFNAIGDPVAVNWASVPVNISDERGLLGLALHPDFPDSPFVYVYHTNPSPLVNRIVRFSDVGGLGTDPLLFYDGLPAAAQYHHGGRLAFGPDRNLYVTYGEQTEPATAQDIDDRRGKILRLGLGGKPAFGNPFGPSNPAYAYGVRNPFGICFDPRDGIGYFTENGPDCDDEVNRLAIGVNYGWGPDDFCDGQPAPSYPAIARFTPTIAPTGCVLYRGDGYGGRFDGDFFFGSYNEGNIRRIRFVAGTVDVVDTLEIFAQFDEPILDVTVGPDELLWVSTFTSLWRIRPPFVTSVDGPAAPARLTASPNPFVRGVSFRLPAGAFVDADVLDITGRSLRAWHAAGGSSLTWDGRDWSGAEVPAGVYFLRVRGDAGSLTKRLVKIGR